MMSQEVIDTTGKILMANFCGVSAKENGKGFCNHKLINHCDFHKFNLSKGFVEFNGLDIVLEGKKYTQKYIRLYFDVDCKSDSKEEAMNEYIMLGLRLTSGISKSKFFEKFNINIKEHFNQIDQLIKENLLIEKDDLIFIPEDLFYISNYIITKII